MVVKDKKGIALVSALLILLALSIIGVIAINTTVTDTKISGNLKGIKQAFYIADAGISHAGALLQQNIGTWDTYSLSIATTALGDGSYSVTASNVDGTNKKKVVSTGRTSTGAKATIEAIFIRAKFTPDDAITTNGDLKISGNANILGSSGSVQSNSDLKVSGKPTIAQGGSASGTADPSPPYTSGASTVSIPEIDPTDFASYADYKLASDGKVYDSEGNLLWDTNTQGEWKGWDYSNPNPKWTLSSDDTPPYGNLYIVGDAKVSGNPGSASVPWETTLIVTGDLEISGNPYIVNYTDPSDPIGVQNLLFVAGGKLKISGNVTQTGKGIIAAYEGIKISGNPTLNGAIIGGNATEDKENKISGNPTITYNGGLLSPFSSNTVSILAWRQVNK